MESTTMDQNKLTLMANSIFTNSSQFVDYRGLSTGLYIMKVSTPAETFNLKFVKKSSLRFLAKHFNNVSRLSLSNLFVVNYLEMCSPC